MAATIAPRDGCEVMPDIEEMAASTTSTPALAAAIIGGDAVAGGVVGVEVDREVGEGRAQDLDEQGRGAGLEQAGHVLDGEHVGAELASWRARST
jgi:hypothetical protein